MYGSSSQRAFLGIAAPAALWLALGGVALQAAASPPSPPLGLPDRGVLRLQLGTSDQPGDPAGTTSHEPNRWIHELVGSPGMEQTISTVGKCGYGTSGDNLAILTAAGGNGDVGLGPDSIGVANGPKGVACYRISYNYGEKLTVRLGPDLGLADANAFYRLELDLETKSNAEFVLEIFAGNALTATYNLRTGSSIRTGQGSDAPPYADNIFNCRASSDSGPDSGPNDNCRFIVDELGQSFRLTPVAGEGSLEGGGDYGPLAFANNTLIYLTEAEIGALGCDNALSPESTNTNTIGDGINDAACSVTRIDPTGFGGQCTIAIGYIFRNVDDAEGCELIKSPGEQLAASIAITFPPEPRTALGAEPKTEIEFSDGAGGTVPFTPERCTGTVVHDRNGKQTIAEVLSPTGGYPDIVPGGHKDWACILESDVEYLGPAASPKMQVSQTILFWGDIRFSRD